MWLVYLCVPLYRFYQLSAPMLAAVCFGEQGFRNFCLLRLCIKHFWEMYLCCNKYNSWYHKKRLFCDVRKYFFSVFMIHFLISRIDKLKYVFVNWAFPDIKKYHTCFSLYNWYNTVNCYNFLNIINVICDIRKAMYDIM